MVVIEFASDHLGHDHATVGNADHRQGYVPVEYLRRGRSWIRTLSDFDEVIEPVAHLDPEKMVAGGVDVLNQVVRRDVKLLREWVAVPL